MHVRQRMENHDELFVNVGGYEPEGMRPIYVFSHVLHDRQFPLDMIPGVYNTLIHAQLIQDPKTVCIIVTIDRVQKRVTIVNHSDANPMLFTREEVYSIFWQCLTMKRKYLELLVVGYDQQQEHFYTKFNKSENHSSDEAAPPEGLDEIGEIVYCYTSKPILLSH